jgi:hypothetical protein
VYRDDDLVIYHVPEHLWQAPPTMPTRIFLGQGWHQLESNAEDRWRWTTANCTFNVTTLAEVEKETNLNLTLAAFNSTRTIQVEVNGSPVFTAKVEAGPRHTLNVPIKLIHGNNQIHLVSLEGDQPANLLDSNSHDNRKLAFVIYAITLT